MSFVFPGHLNPHTDSGLPSFKSVLTSFFREYSHGVFTARGNSVAIWKHDGYYYMFDPHGCDENGTWFYVYPRLFLDEILFLLRFCADSLKFFSDRLKFTQTN